MPSKKKKQVVSDQQKSYLENGHGTSEPLSFDQIVSRALSFCDKLPHSCAPYRSQLSELEDRLARGRLQLAVLGQFNRGKSTFINALLGMKILPTSVLPLTSVPTIIEYGHENRCTVRFLDGTEDHVVKGSIKDIEATLRLYVAEENNPKNRFHVRDVSITCESPLLMNGTVLIDTPGFGSTHRHNTKTTLDLLVECDAALFVLSTDPPMTQTEMDFLSQVKGYVPKIFFILNKIDLLTDDEASQIDSFIKRLMHNQLGLPSDIDLYHTCALKGESATPRTAENPEWERSGIEQVRKDVLDFMLREKYFTLSEALGDKFKNAMNGIRSELETALNTKREPIKKTEQNLKDITERIQDLTFEMEHELKEAGSSEKDTRTLLEQKFESSSEEFESRINAKLENILQEAYFPAEAASIASTLLPRLIADYSLKLVTSLLETNNGKLRKVILKHCSEFSGQIQKASQMASSQLHEPSAEELISALEIPLSEQKTDFDEDNFPIPQPKISDLFKSKTKRLDAVREFYLPLCRERIGKQLEYVEKQGIFQVNESWNNLKKRISQSHMSVIDSLKNVHEREEYNLEKRREKLVPEIRELEELLRECTAIENLAV
ncbi:MAG: dynamin family protein [Chitinispirillaceae bacterium]